MLIVAGGLRVRARRGRSRQIAEREMALQLVEWLAIELGVGINEIVERIALLCLVEPQIASRGELDAIHIVRAEEIFALVGMLPGFGCIHWKPAAAFDI